LLPVGGAVMEENSDLALSILFPEGGQNAFPSDLQIDDDDIDAAFNLLNQLGPDQMVGMAPADRDPTALLANAFTSFSAPKPEPQVQIVTAVPVEPLPLKVPDQKPTKKRTRPDPDQLGRKLTRREANTLCEARRRDKLNDCIQELARLSHLPYKSTNKDKCTVLSHVAAVLRTRKMINHSLDKLVASKSPVRNQVPDPTCTVEIGFFVLSLQMQVIDVSSLLLNTLGYTSPNAQDQVQEDRNMGNGMSFVHPEFVGQVYVDMARLLSNEATKLQHHERLKCQDGTYKWFMCSVTLGEHAGQPAVFGAVAETPAPGGVMVVAAPPTSPTK